ncbi:phage tail terminator protein [Lysinibacillus sp. NPDC093216]|uniref:phage tail terminator protein n=1 Tax=Lysinibacillus sp. NPDC093216 TaxID=3390576 RepID=UPI003D05A628
MKELDFLVQLNRYINKQNFFAKSVIGVLGKEESLSIMAMPGGAEKVFFDGTRDKDYQVQINAKSRKQDDCINTLSTLFQKLESLTELPSDNNSYDFQQIVVTSLPSLVMIEESGGYFIYELSISATITIHKGVV